MKPELLQQAKQIWDRTDRAFKFQGRFDIFPYREGARLVDDSFKLAEGIALTEVPTTQEQVNTNELKRRLVGNAVYWDHALSGRFYTFEDAVSLFGIEERDIKGLRSWLSERREGVLETIDRVYQETEVDEDRYSTPLDLPGLKVQAEQFSGTYINNYHQKLGKVFGEFSAVGNFLRDIISVPTSEGRSYFDTNTNTLALGISAITYMSADRTLHINERALIRLFGHEGMGHGLNKVVTDASDLPFFLKTLSWSTRPTVESVGQFYETVIFNDLARSPRTQKELGVQDRFPEIYKDEQDTSQIEYYNRKLMFYAISVLADRNLGEPMDPGTMRKKVGLLADVALYPGYAVGMVEGQRQNYDSEGNLSFNLVQEIVYAAQPVQRVLEMAKEKGLDYDSKRSELDKLILTGFWTPIGLVENAQVALGR